MNIINILLRYITPIKLVNKIMVFPIIISTVMSVSIVPYVHAFEHPGPNTGCPNGNYRYIPGEGCLVCNLPKVWSTANVCEVPPPGQGQGDSDAAPGTGASPGPAPTPPPVYTEVPVVSPSETAGMNLGSQPGGTMCNLSNPINSATGNKVQIAVDYTGEGSSSLRFVRYYNSLSPKIAKMGNNWRHNYDRQIVLDTTASPNTATLISGDGSEVIFFDLVDGWTARAGVLAKLTSTDEAWTYIDSNDTVETYTKTSGSDITSLSKISTRSGRSQTLAYESGKLVQVVDDFGHTFSLSYDQVGRLKLLTLPSLKTIQYNYVNENLSNVVYQDYSVVKYIYDKPGFPNHLTGIIDQDSNRVATWTYDDQGRGTGSSHGSTADNVTISYNADGSSTFTDALSQERTYNHVTSNGVHKVASIIGPECLTCGSPGQNKTYDGNGFPDIVIDFKGNITDYDYNARGLVEKVTEAKGTSEQRSRLTQWHADFHVPICVIAPYSTTSMTYTASGQLTSRIIYDTKNASLFPTAADKECTSITSRSDRVNLNQRHTDYTYFSNGLLKTLNSSRSDVPDLTHYEYDASGNLISITNALGHVVTLQDYDERGRATTFIDPNGLVTTITYDAVGRKDTVTVGQEVTYYDYYLSGLLHSVTTPNGAYLEYQYDDAQRLTDIYDQLGNHIHYTLNDLGSRIQTDTMDLDGVIKRTRSAVYDLENRLTTVQGAANQSTDYLQYDANGNLEKIRDAGMNVTNFSYDALDRIKTTTDANQGVTVYLYDANNNQLSVTDPRGNITKYIYDGLGNRTQKTSPDTGITNYTAHDTAGNVLSMTDARGKTTTYRYDALNRLVLITYDDGTTTENVYDVGANAIGQRSDVIYSRATAGVITDSWTYDQQGYVLSHSQASDGVTLTSSYAYNPVTGEMRSTTTPGGHTIRYTYVNAQVNEISMDGEPVLSNIAYDPFGPATSWTWGNNTVYSRDYDLDGQLVSYPQGEQTLSNRYFPSGNVQDISDMSTATVNQAFDYDALHRVTYYLNPQQAANDSDGGDGGGDGGDGSLNSGSLDSLLAGLPSNLTYVYDALGNRINLTMDTVGYTSRVNVANNQLDSQTGPQARTYLYDAAGNTVSNGIQTYAYDARGRFITFTQNGQSVQYAINGLGQRIRKYGSEDSQEGDVNGDGFVNQQDVFAIQKINEGSANDGPVTHCNNNDSDSAADETCVQNVVDSGDSRELPFSARVRFAYNQQGQLVGDYDEYGNLIQEIVWFAGQPVALIQDDDMYYVHTDHLGTPRAVVDDNNEVVWQWKSDPFGVALANEDVDGDGERFVNHLRFPGQYYDVESGLHYNLNRTYDPKTGRYIESDPIGLEAGLNTYGYVGGNPVNSMDPSGLVKYVDLGFALVDFGLSTVEATVGGLAIIGSPLTGPFLPATATGGSFAAVHGAVGMFNSGNAIIDALTETKSQGLFESVGAVFGPTGQKIGQGVDLLSGIRPGAVTGNLYDLANGTNTMKNAFGNNANSTSGNASNPQSTIIDNGYQCTKL